MLASTNLCPLASAITFVRRIAKDPRFERITCDHKGTYADDCLVNRVTEVRSSSERPPLLPRRDYDCSVFVLAAFVTLSLECIGNHAPPISRSLFVQHRCYIVATCDKDLKRRIRKVPGVPIMFIAGRKFTVERLPEAFGAPR